MPCIEATCVIAALSDRLKGSNKSEIKGSVFVRTREILDRS